MTLEIKNCLITGATLGTIGVHLFRLTKFACGVSLFSASWQAAVAIGVVANVYFSLLRKLMSEKFNKSASFSWALFGCLFLATAKTFSEKGLAGTFYHFPAVMAVALCLLGTTALYTYQLSVVPLSKTAE